MPVDQIFQHWCGNRTNSQHSERMHKEFIGKIARNIQRRSSTFIEQLDQHRHEHFKTEKTAEANVGVLMSLPGGGDGQKEPEAYSELHPMLCWSYDDHDTPLCGDTVEVSAASSHQSFKSGGKSSHTFEIVWKYRTRNIIRSTLEETRFLPM